MHKIIILAIVALTLGGCQTMRQERALGGAVLGGATGALIGGLAGGTGGAALAGGAIGAVAGGMLGAATTPEPCYVRTRWGLRRVSCYY